MGGALQEFYFEDSAPHEALGRAARRLTSGGALYLGAGIGAERVRGEKAETYTVLNGKARETHTGPLSAVTQAFTLAGQKTDAETPGGITAIKDPAVAARIRELDEARVSAQRNLREYEDRLRRTRSQPMWGASLNDEDRWETRRISEVKGQLTRIAAERTRLLSGGKLEEGWVGDLREEAGKPGTNFTQVTPENRKKVEPLVAHYRKQAHPFTACVRDNTKRFGRERAERVCAVVKDMGEGTTKWRKGPKRVREAVTEAEARLAKIDAYLGAGAALQLAESDADHVLTEQVKDDLSLLFITGSLTEDVIDRLGFLHSGADGRFIAKRRSADRPATSVGRAEAARKLPADSRPKPRQASLFAKYDDDGLRAALTDEQLTGKRRREAEREARRRGLAAQKKPAEEVRQRPENVIARLQAQLSALPQGNENRTPEQREEAERLRKQIRDLRKGLKGLQEGFDPNQPRDAEGRWKPKVGDIVTVVHPGNSAHPPHTARVAVDAIEGDEVVVKHSEMSKRSSRRLVKKKRRIKAADFREGKAYLPASAAPVRTPDGYR